MKNYSKPYFSEKSYIKNQVNALTSERLSFLGNERLGDIDLMEEDPEVCRKVRRIMEKRICQKFWKNASLAKRSGNRARFETRHQLSNHFRNIYGTVPKHYRLTA